MTDRETRPDHAAALPDTGTGAAATVREAVLSGARPGETINRAWDDLLSGSAAAFLSSWFGTATISRFAGDAAAAARAIDQDILRIDEILAARLDGILHHKAVQALEARWRGLRWLIDQIEEGPGDHIVVRVLNVSWREIERDMHRATDFDQSQLFQKIYEAEFGSAGGEPYGLLLVDHEVRDHPADDMAVLEHLAGIAAASFAPLVIGAAPELLNTESFAELGPMNDPAAPLRDPRHAGWRLLRDRADARFVAVALPRVLARPPWVDDCARADGFRYRERARHAADRVWMTSAFAFAAVAARAAARFGWPADVRGADAERVGGGLVTGLPAEPHRLSQTFALPRLPVEIVFTDHQERLLIEAGLMPLGALPHRDDLVFGAVRSLSRTPRPAGPAGEAEFADSRVATQFNSMLCASRFAHYLKVRGREAVGRLRRAEDVELNLRKWLEGFVNKNATASAETRASHPLFDAAVRVTERRDQPGVFNCSIELQPYFQLDNVTANFTFDTEIAPPRS